MKFASGVKLKDSCTYWKVNSIHRSSKFIKIFPFEWFLNGLLEK